MKIDFISDVACPWCAVGLNALEQAVARLGPDAPVQLHFQPFELNPAMPPEGEDTAEHLARKYGASPERLAEMRQTLDERGAAVGFHFGERPRIWNTFDAHRLLHWAGLQDDAQRQATGVSANRQRALKHALLDAYHARGENPGATDVLLRIANDVGLDVEEARQVLATDRHAEAVREREQFYQQHGIRAVPTVVIDDRHLIQGSQPPEVFERALRELLAQR